MEDLTAKITNAGGPASSGTKAEANKFHDDKSLYTGTVLSCSMPPEHALSSLCCNMELLGQGFGNRLLRLLLLATDSF